MVDTFLGYDHTHYTGVLINRKVDGGHLLRNPERERHDVDVEKDYTRRGRRRCWRRAAEKKLARLAAGGPPTVAVVA